MLLIATMGIMVFCAPTLSLAGALSSDARSFALAALSAPGCFLLGFVAIHLVSYLNPRVMQAYASKIERAMAAAGGMFALGMLPSALPAAQQPWYYLAVSAGCLAAGAATGALMLCWGRVWSMVGHAENGAVLVARNTALGVAFAAAIASLVMFAPYAVTLLCLIAMIIGSCLLNVSCTKRLARCEPNDSDRHREDEAEQTRPRLITRASFTSLTSGLSFGVVFALITLSFEVSDALLVVAVAALLAAACSLALALRSGIPRVPELEHTVFLVVGLSLLARLLLPDVPNAVALCLACAALVSYYIFNPNTLTAVSFLDRALSSYHCARENVVSLIATIIGWGAAVGATAAGVPLETTTTAVGLACLAAMLAEPLFTPYMSNCAIDQLITLGVKPGETERDNAARAQLEWRKRCVDICRSCELSPRETEVFMLLARGRNSAHIAESLVISPHTARTHIYRIYQKTNVSSHQELLDLIDQDQS